MLETREGASSRGGDLASLSTDAASNAAAANALIDAAVQKVAADKGIARCHAERWWRSWRGCG